MRLQYNRENIAGISQKNRTLLDELNRKVKAPFTIAESRSVLNLSMTRARRLIGYWVSRGWLTRIKKGLYTTTPLGAIKPSERKEDPWIVAAIVFDPCYIGGWSACEHWELTDQIFNDIVVFSSRKVRAQKNSIQGTAFLVKTIKRDKIFGVKIVWRAQTKINISDPSRTLVDILNDPYIGGGIRNTALILKEYFSEECKNEAELLKYISMLGNRTVYKRLGYLLEKLKIDSPIVIKTCEKNISLGYSKLDPNLPLKGRIIRRWNLRINASIKI